MSNVLKAQCDTMTQSLLVLDINPDSYIDEISWTITDITGSQLLYAASPSNEQQQSFSYCLPKDACLVFTMKDSYGDGMFPDGQYKLTLNGVVIRNNPNGNYDYAEATIFNCGAGQFCDMPLTAVVGNGTSTLNQSWYAFTPVDTGIYTISTCGSVCSSKIWVYDNCSPGLVVDSSNLGTIAYANGGCNAPELGAKLSLNMAGNKTYYIRLGYSNINCPNTPLDYSIQYDGPVVGCTDPLSCNFEPLATVNDTSLCIYLGDPGCDDLPDLEVHRQAFVNSIKLDTESNSDACLVQEGCIRGYGLRNLVKFSTRIDNIGKRDYYIGEAPFDVNQPNAQFVYDPCHGHWHYRGYAEYLLYDTNGKRIPIGSKTGFCVLDLYCPAGGNATYTCETMGISVDCSDEYDSSLPCQWVDVTGLPAGQYQLVIKVNSYEEPDRNGRPEMTYENNYASTCIELGYSANGTANISIVPNCDIFVDCDNRPFGPNTPDCEGNCNGGVLIGDINKNQTRDQSDVNWYLDQTIAPSASTTQCNDLNDDGKFSLHDAALLQQCKLHSTDSLYWGSRPSCPYPIDIFNQFDRPNFRIQTVNTVAQYVDIQVVNPNNKQVGFDFTLSGMVIDKVENSVPTFQPTFVLDKAQGRVVALAQTEAMLPKSSAFGNLIRVYYASLTNDTICLTINETVNEYYERSNFILTTPSCRPSVIVSQKEVETAEIELITYPNPAEETITLLVPDQFGRNAQVQMTNMEGTTVRAFPTVGQQIIEIGRKGMPSGIYILSVIDENQKAITKVIWL
jgi:hypothetical protein